MKSGSSCLMRGNKSLLKISCRILKMIFKCILMTIQSISLMGGNYLCTNMGILNLFRSSTPRNQHTL